MCEIIPKASMCTRVNMYVPTVEPSMTKNTMVALRIKFLIQNSAK